MLFWIIFLLCFVVGTFLLLRTKNERQFVIFLIRTKHFLKLIDRIANLSPGFWKFFADLAIVFSFSGLGAMYLSPYRKENKNLDVILLLIFLSLILMFPGNLLTTVLLLSEFYMLWKLLKEGQCPQADFVAFFGLCSMAWFGIMRMSTFIDISNVSYLISISMIAGLVGIPGLVILTFLYQSYLILLQNVNVPGVSPFIPSEKGGEIGLEAPGTGVFIPIGYALLGIITAMLFHELAHGILARVHKIKVKSTGIATLGILPIGAFVEPDEKEMDKKESLIRTRIFAVGSFANFLVAMVSFALMLFSPLVIGPYAGDGITILATQEGYPAYGTLKPGAVIYEINAMQTKNVDQFQAVMKNIKPNETIKLKTTLGDISLTAAVNPKNSSASYIGISLMQHIPEFFSEGFFWIFFINFSLSLVNLLPVIPLDGGRILKEFIMSFNLRKKTQNRIFYGVIAAILVLVLVNVFPLFRMAIDSVVRLFV